MDLQNSNVKLEVAEIKQAIEDYGNLVISKKQLMKKLCGHTHYFHKFKDLFNSAEKLRSISIKERKLIVVYITGKAGSGKTTFAKYFADKLNFDYFVSGGGEDILDGYDKEECIILDDYRGGIMRFSELLKFLDNNTNSTIASRYHNKDISNCKLIVITSINRPNDLYKSFHEMEDKEPIEQLYRRIKHSFYEIDDSGLIYKYIIDKINQNGLKTNELYGNMKDIYKELGIDLEENDDNPLMEQFKLEDIPFEELPF